MFEFYVLNYNHNSKKVEMFNIFNNWVLDNAVQKEVKKYIRNPSKYKSMKYNFETKEDDYIFGFEGFKQEILSLIRWQEWSRCEYEIGVTEPFTQDLNTIENGVFIILYNFVSFFMLPIFKNLLLLLPKRLNYQLPNLRIEQNNLLLPKIS